jgi:hypothetical protein
MSDHQPPPFLLGGGAIQCWVTYIKDLPRGMLAYSHRVEIFYTFLLEVDDCRYPVHVSDIDRDQDHVLGEDIHLRSGQHKVFPFIHRQDRKSSDHLLASGYSSPS